MIRSSTRITRISRQAFAGPQTTSYSSIATQNATLGDSLQSILSSFSEDATYAPTVNNKTTLNLLTSNDAIASLREIRQMTKMNVKKTVSLFKEPNNQFSFNDYSIFVNRLFDSHYSSIEMAEDNLDVWKRLYQIYRVFVVNDCATLNLIMLHDLNQFIKLFLDYDDLPSARGAFQLILKNSPDGEIPKHTETINMYFRLYCGGFSKFWNKQSSNSDYNDFVGTHPLKETKDFRCYPVVGLIQFKSFLRKLLEDPGYSSQRNTEMDSLIIHSLGFYKDIPFLNQYIELLYGIDQNGNFKKEVALSNKLYPDSQLMSSIVSSYSYNDDIITGIKITAGFLKEYPEILLEKPFWRRLVYWSCKTWDKYNDKKGTIPKKCWKIMVDWHQAAGRPIQFDQRMMLERLRFLKSSGDYLAAIQDVETCFKGVYKKSDKDKFSSERLMLYDYQRYIIKSLTFKYQNKKCVDFISQWKVDYQNGKFMEEYFQQMVEALNLKNAIKTERSPNDEDDDYNFSLLGTNIL